MEYEMCLLFKKGSERICFGAAGRKLRLVCVFCPNFWKYETGRDRDGDRTADRDPDHDKESDKEKERG